MTLKHIALLAFLFAELHAFGQKWDKPLSKVKQFYNEGNYLKSYSFNDQLIKKLERDSAQLSNYLADTYLYKAKNLEALNKYKSVDEYTRRYLAIVEKSFGRGSLSFGNALLNISEIYVDYGYGKQADSLNRLASGIFESKTITLPREDLIHLKFLECSTGLLNGFYNNALDTLYKYIPHIKENSNTPYYTLLPNHSKKIAKNIVYESKITYGRWMNMASRLYLNKGDFKKLDSSLYHSHQWMIKNLKKSDLPYYENIYLYGLFYTNHPDKTLSILYFDQALKFAGKKNYKAHRLSIKIYEDLLYTFISNGYRNSYNKASKNFRGLVLKNYGLNSAAYIKYQSLEIQDQIGGNRTKDAVIKYLELLEEKFLPAIHPERIKLLTQLYNVEISTQKYQNAIQRIKEVVALREKLNGNSPVYYMAKTELANHTVKFSNAFSSAEKLYDESFFIHVRNNFHPFHEKYVSTLNNIATLYEQTDRFQQASQILENAKNITLNKYSRENINYGLELEKIAAIQINIGEYVKAAENLNNAIQIFEDTYDESTASYYAKALETQAKLLMIKGLYEDAITNLKKSEKIYIKSESANNLNTIDELANIFIRLGRFTETEDLLKYSLKEKEGVFGTDHRFLIPTLNQLSHLSLVQGNYAEAERLSQRSLNIALDIFGKASTKICPALLIQSEIYSSLGDYDRASEAVSKVIDIQSARLGKDHIEIASSLSHLAAINLYKGEDLNKTESVFLEAKKIFYDKLGALNPFYAQVLIDLAALYAYQQKFDMALDNLNEAKKILTNNFGKENTLSSANIYISIGDIYIKQKNFRKAEEFYNKAKKIYDKILNNEHPNYVQILSKLAKMYYMEGEYDQSRKNIEAVLENYSQYINSYLPSLSESGKTKFWNLITPDFEFYNSLALDLLKSNPHISQNLFNNALLTKSLLLSSSLKIKERILNSNDEKLKVRYKEWIEKKELLANFTSLTNQELEQNKIEPDKIFQEVEKLERELSERSELFKESYEKVKIDWKKIQSSLKEDEAAIEIIRFRSFKDSFQDSIIYAALIVKPEYKSGPEIVLLKNGNDLESKHLKIYRNSIKFKIEDLSSYKQFWEPIKNKLGKVKKIYLSPEGVYNQVNLETLLIEKDKYVLDEDNIVIVNNTKDLFLKKIHAKPVLEAKTVSIFGNPKFYTQNESSSEITINDLPGSEIESKELTSLMEQNHWQSNVYLSFEASEENVKMLNSPRVFHIATHGFFMPDQGSEETKSKSESFVLQNPMFRSGLMLKGAGELIKNNYNIYNINRENGILTAYEAMNLNLDNTDLVVLSACETGLGDVKVGEGIYGLQRAFLVAGAKSIIMSLFKVSDEATQKLMVSFYKKWLETGNKRDSFIAAKKEIRNEYKDPIYWGAFVMIGIE